jgi:hypothetical protein
MLRQTLLLTALFLLVSASLTAAAPTSGGTSSKPPSSSRTSGSGNKQVMIAYAVSSSFVQVSNTAVSVQVVPPTGDSFKRGQQVTFSLRLTNTLPQRQVTLQATGTYTDASGQTQTVSSNSVTLNIDESITLQTFTISVTNLNITSVTYANGSAVPNTNITSTGATITNLVVPQGNNPMELRVTGTIR